MSEFNQYHCWHCGKLTTKDEEPILRVFCDDCKELHASEHADLVERYSKMKIQIMFETAIRKMENKYIYMYEYYKSAQKIFKQAMEDTTKFLSSDEMIVAIVLDEFNYDFEANYKIGKYRIDFYIPELKACLEVDGWMHDYKTVKDSRRDIDIRAMLGSEWEIVRMSTQYVEKYPPKIPEAIEVLVKQKRKIRAENNGIIPEYYSKREKNHYDKIGEHHTQRVRKV